MVIENFDITDTPKTSKIFDTLQNMGIAHMKIVVGIVNYDDILFKSIRNISRASIEQVSHFSPYLLLAQDRIILMRKAFEELVKSRGGEVKSLKRQELYSQGS